MSLQGEYLVGLVLVALALLLLLYAIVKALVENGLPG